MTDKVTLLLEAKLEVVFNLLGDGDVKSAKFIMKKAIRKQPNHYLSLYAQAMVAAFQDKNQDAEKYLLQSIAKNDKYGLAHYNFANLNQKLGRFDLMIAHYAIALEVATPDELELMEQAKDTLKTILASLPEGFTIEKYLEDAGRFEQAYNLMAEGSYEEAIELFDIVASNQPEHVQARGNLGICFLMLKEYNKAREMLNQALIRDPDYKPAIDNLLVLENLESGKLANPLGMIEINTSKLGNS